MHLVAEQSKKSFSIKRLKMFFESSDSMSIIYLVVAALIHLSNAIVYYENGLIGIELLSINLIFAGLLLGTSALSIINPFFKKHLNIILYISLYLIMMQSIFESYSCQHDVNHIVMLLIVYMVTCMPFKKVSALNLFLAINFILIIASVLYVPVMSIDKSVTILIFLTGGIVSAIALGSKLRTQAKLRANEEFFKNMFNESAGANFLSDLDTMKTVSCNKKSTEMFEANEESQLLGVDTQLFQVSSFNSQEIEKIKAEVKDNWGWSKEVEFKTLKGKIFWGNLEYRVVQFQSKPFMQIRISDISDRKRLEKLLLSEKQTLELASKVDGLEKPFTLLIKNIEEICPSIKCSILLTDSDKQSLKFGYASSIDRNYVNAIEKYTLSHGTGLNHTALITKKLVEIKSIDISKIENETSFILDLDGIYACSAFPIISDEGIVLGTLSVYFYNNREVNGQEKEIINRVMNLCRVLLEKETAVEANKQFVTTLQVKNEELIKTNTELDRFVYSTSHDLRVPIVNIMGLLDITNMTLKDDAPKKYLDMIKQSAVALDDVIKGILDYSRNSRSEIEITEVDLKEVVSKVQDTLKGYASFNNIQFRIKMDEGYPLYTDKNRLSVVLSNLISNSIKYYNKKEIQPFISITAKINEKNALIYIEDNGIGIPEEYQQKIFDMFYRASSQATGSGLGLYILKETLNKLEGNISVISGEDIGSTFVIEIPNNFLEHKQTLQQSA
jgi:signal transduction histidine kinase